MNLLGVGFLEGNLDALSLAKRLEMCLRVICGRRSTWRRVIEVGSRQNILT